MSFRFDDSLKRGTSFRSSEPATPQGRQKGRVLGSLPSFGDLLRLLPDPPKTNSLKWYVVGFAICAVAFAMPLVRLRFTGNHDSSIAAAVFWLPSNVSNCIIVMYPWYTVVGRENVPYLRVFYKVAIVFTFGLAALGFLAELYVPNDPMHGFEPDRISDKYRIVTSIRWTWSFVVGFIVAPLILIRSSDRFEATKKRQLYFVVFPSVLYAYFSLLMRDLTGDESYITAAAWVVIMWVILLIYDRNADCDTQPTYMILTSFMITSLTFTAGTMMLGWFEVATPFGQLFVLVVWELLVFIVRHVVARSAAMATNADHATAFVFNVVLAGEMYSEFVFLRIDFNTPVFWGLLLLSSCSVIISEGGLLDDLDLWLKVSFVPWAKRVILCSKEEPKPIPLEVKAHMLRYQWRINDLTMIAEFVALCSGVCSVMFEYIYHHAEVGADTLTYEYPPGERLDQIKVFGVLAVAVLCAQLVARLMIRRKVTAFKLEVLKARGREPEPEPPTRLSEFMEPIMERLSEVMEHVAPLRRNSQRSAMGSADGANGDSLPDVDSLPPSQTGPPLKRNMTVDNSDIRKSNSNTLQPPGRRGSGGPLRRNSDPDLRRPRSARLGNFDLVDLESTIQRTLDEVNELIEEEEEEEGSPKVTAAAAYADVELAAVQNGQVESKAADEPPLKIPATGPDLSAPTSPSALSDRKSVEGGKFIDSLRRHETHDLDRTFWRTHFNYFVATVVFTVINVIFRVVQLNYEL